MKYKNKALITEVVRLARLGYCVAAVGQALGCNRKTVQMLAVMAPAEVVFGNRRFLKRMTRPLMWKNNPNKVSPNLVPMLKKVLRAVEFGTNWPVATLEKVYPGIGREMLYKWQKWHEEEQIARCQIHLEIQRVEEGRPLKKKRKPMKYIKREHFVRFDKATGKWFDVPTPTRYLPPAPVPTKIPENRGLPTAGKDMAYFLSNNF